MMKAIAQRAWKVVGRAAPSALTPVSVLVSLTASRLPSAAVFQPSKRYGERVGSPE